MADLHVVAVITAKPGSADALGAALGELVTASRQEDGCLSYDFYTTTADASVFVTVETWRSQDDLEAHFRTPHLARAMEVGGDLFAAPPAIHTLVPFEA